MRKNQDWHKGYLLGDINFLLVCSEMTKDLSEDDDGKPCVYIHYKLNKDKYLGWFCFETEKERDEFYLSEINNEVMEQIALCAILEEPDEIETKTSGS